MGCWLEAIALTSRHAKLSQKAALVAKEISGANGSEKSLMVIGLSYAGRMYSMTHLT